ncbi:MAG: serine/threonine-protein phosphatase [Bryobacterales bacterium]|nr:serine/threonine-protein phosphatase [Bryobacterales bacterium]
MRFLTHSISRTGGREVNQDAAEHCAAGDLACWVLADGLGGHGSGEEASRLAAAAVMEAFRAQAECSPSALLAYIGFARNAVLKRQEENAIFSGMRTTLVILVSDMRQALWAHVGDTRLYLFRDGQLARQTLDHSVPQAMVDARQLDAVGIRHHEDRNRLLRSIGGREEVRATIEETPHPLRPGDAFLLCSDGFWEYVTETAMEVDLAKSAAPAEWLRYMELRIRADAPADQDNYSAVAIFAAP